MPGRSVNLEIHVQMEVRPETNGACRCHNFTGFDILYALSTKRDLERKFTTEGEGGRPPSECEVLSGGLREASRITHQLSKGDLKAKSGFLDDAGSHPLHKMNFLYCSYTSILRVNVWK